MPGEYDALSSQVTQLQQNKQDKVTFYNSEPLPSEGSDGDTRFVSIPGQGLFSFVKYMGHWYSRLYKDFVTTLEDEITQTVTTTIESTTSYSTLAISGNLSVGGATTFTGGTTGLLHEDLGDVDTGSGGPHNEYIKGSVFNSSVDFNTSGLDNSIASLTLSLTANGGLTRSSGIKIDESFEPTWSAQHIFTYSDSLNPGAIDINSGMQRKIKLRETGSLAYIGSSNSGDLILQGVATNGPASILINKEELAITGMSHTEHTATFTVGSNNYANGDYVFIVTGVGANGSVETAFDKQWFLVTATTGTAVTISSPSSGCSSDTIGTGAMVRQGNHFGSSTFSSGFTGSGFRISNDLETTGGHTIETDNLIVRGNMSVYELLINQIRTTNGSLIVGQSIELASSSQTPGYSYGNFTASTEGAHPFVNHDILIAQYWDGSSTVKKYIIVSNAGWGDDNQFFGGFSNPSSWFDIANGKTLVRIGNSYDADRRGGLYLTSDDSNAPFLSIWDGVTTASGWNTSAKEKLRLGNLSGVTSTVTGSLSGYGLWSDNAYLEGEIVATAGYIGDTTNGWSISSTGITNQSGNSLISVGDTTTFDSAATSFYIDGNGQFSLKDKFKVESGGDVYLTAVAGSAYLKASSAGLEMWNNSVKTLELKASGEVTLGQVASGKANFHMSASGGTAYFRNYQTNTITIDGTSGLITLSNALTSGSSSFSAASSYAYSNFFLGDDSGTKKFYVGKGTGGGTPARYLKWDGTDLNIRGKITTYPTTSSTDGRGGQIIIDDSEDYITAKGYSNTDGTFYEGIAIGAGIASESWWSDVPSNIVLDAPTIVLKGSNDVDFRRQLYINDSYGVNATAPTQPGGQLLSIGAGSLVNGYMAIADSKLTWSQDFGVVNARYKFGIELGPVWNYNYWSPGLRIRGYSSLHSDSSNKTDKSSIQCGVHGHVLRVGFDSHSNGSGGQTTNTSHPQGDDYVLDGIAGDTVWDLYRNTSNASYYGTNQTGKSEISAGIRWCILRIPRSDSHYSNWNVPLPDGVNATGILGCIMAARMWTESGSDDAYLNLIHQTLDYSNQDPDTYLGASERVVVRIKVDTNELRLWAPPSGLILTIYYIAGNPWQMEGAGTGDHDHNFD